MPFPSPQPAASNPLTEEADVCSYFAESKIGMDEKTVGHYTHRSETSPIHGEVSILKHLAYLCVCENILKHGLMFVFSAYQEGLINLPAKKITQACTNLKPLLRKLSLFPIQNFVRSTI